MTHRFAAVTFTEDVKAAQEHYGSRAHNERLQINFGPGDQLGRQLNVWLLVLGVTEAAV